jgi:arabinose-5-phosphate isomerase
VIDLQYARQVLERESQVIGNLVAKVDKGFAAAAETILNCPGRTVVTGMGKAGIIGQKIAATLSSTGTPALFLHPAEAVHGDLGAVQADDVVLALSNSGESQEVLRLLPILRKIGARILAMTSSAQTTLGEKSDAVLELGHIQEACPLGLAPSASTAAMLAMGDALALTVLKAREFTREDFAIFHPAGELGRQMLTVGELMRTGENCPRVAPEDLLLEVLTTMTKVRSGSACVVDTDGRLLGLFTDGDFRRFCSKSSAKINSAPVKKCMSTDPTTITPDKLAAEALAIMRKRKFDELPVVDENGLLAGLLDVQDLLSFGVV